MKNKSLACLALFLAALAALLVGCGHKTSSSGSTADDDAADDDAADDDVSPTDDDASPVADDDDNIPAGQFLPPAPAGKKWTMIWNDEFDGTELDASKWTTYGSEANPEPHRDGYWVKEATYLDGQGHLVIETYEKDGKYYDGCVDTTHSFSHTTGYYETKMKVHTQVGHWIAFWMIGGNTSAPTAVDGEEIDIIEKAWVQGSMADWIQSTLHWDGSAGWDEINYSAPQCLTGYHTYGLWWTGTLYTFYLDGVAFWTSDKGGICGVPLPMIISDEIGNEFFDNGTIEQATLPDYSYFDYVRAFDLVDK